MIDPQFDLLVEAVVLSFCMGAILGGVIVAHLVHKGGKEQ